MTLTRRLLLFLVVVNLSASAFAQVAAPPATLTPAEMETFLLTARIERFQSAGDGITNSRRATLTDGRITHDAHIQTVDESKAIFETPRGVELNFKDTYRYNIAGYRLARLLGIDNVPVCVGRDVQGLPASVMWWADGVVMDEGDRTKQQATDPNSQRMASNIHLMRVFDELIKNTDRNLGNLLWKADWTMVLIDHTRAFRLGADLRSPMRLERIDRALFQKLRELTPEALTEAVGDSLNRQEIEGVVARRGVIVKLFEDRIAQRGEAAVLYTRR